VGPIIEACSMFISYGIAELAEFRVPINKSGVRAKQLSGKSPTSLQHLASDFTDKILLFLRKFPDL